MIISMSMDATRQDVENIEAAIKEHGFEAHEIRGETRWVIGVVGMGDLASLRDDAEGMSGVEKVTIISHIFKLPSRVFHPDNTVVSFNRHDCSIGDEQCPIMAGPCSIESQQQMDTVAQCLAELRIPIMRGGAFKPRTSPHSFQGLGEEGLKMMRRAADRHGLLTVSEVMNHSQIGMMLRYVDIFQVGARNMQNYDLLRELGKQDKPVLLKRHYAATVEEFLLSAEYIMTGGNYKVILCERGIRSACNDQTRNTLDLTVIPVIHKVSHLPIVADPSHGTGKRELVIPMAVASMAAGADAIMVEAHPKPNESRSDKEQALSLTQLATMMEILETCHPVWQATRDVATLAAAGD